MLTPLMNNYLKHIQTLHRSCAKQAQLMGYCVCSHLACRWQVQVYLSCIITHVLSDSEYTAQVAHVSRNGTCILTTMFCKCRRRRTKENIPTCPSCCCCQKLFLLAKLPWLTDLHDFAMPLVAQLPHPVHMHMCICL